jgi:hypothetical protein
VTKADLLQEGRDKINENWYKGDDHGTGGHCIVTAVDEWDLYPILKNQLPKKFRGEWMIDPLIRFNDDPNTTKEMVLDLYDRAIDSVRNE